MAWTKAFETEVNKIQNEQFNYVVATKYTNNVEVAKAAQDMEKIMNDAIEKQNTMLTNIQDQNNKMFDEIKILREYIEQHFDRGNNGDNKQDKNQ